MYIPGQHPDALESLVGQHNEALRSSPLPHSGQTPLLIIPGADALPAIGHHGIAIIVRGQLELRYHDRVVLIFQEGDLVNGQLAQESLPLTATSDELTELTRPDISTFSTGQTTTLVQSLLLSGAVLTLALAIHGKGGIRPTAGFSRYPTGKTIIQQGDPADHVFTLLRGSAQVMVDGTRVGTVIEGDIFGALAPLTGDKRQASVIATSDCTVMMVPAAQFVDLIRVQPETSLKLMQLMARQINELNRKVARRLALVT